MINDVIMIGGVSPLAFNRRLGATVYFIEIFSVYFVYIHFQIDVNPTLLTFLLSVICVNEPIKCGFRGNWWKEMKSLSDTMDCYGV